MSETECNEECQDALVDVKVILIFVIGKYEKPRVEPPDLPVQRISNPETRQLYIQYNDGC